LSDQAYILTKEERVAITAFFGNYRPQFTLEQRTVTEPFSYQLIRNGNAADTIRMELS